MWKVPESSILFKNDSCDIFYILWNLKFSKFNVQLNIKRAYRLWEEYKIQCLVFPSHYSHIFKAERTTWLSKTAWPFSSAFTFTLSPTHWQQQYLQKMLIWKTKAKECSVDFRQMKVNKSKSLEVYFKSSHQMKLLH